MFDGPYEIINLYQSYERFHVKLNDVAHLAKHLQVIGTLNAEECLI